MSRPIITYWMDQNKVFEVIGKPLTHRHWHYAVASGIITQKKTTQKQRWKWIAALRRNKDYFFTFLPEGRFPIRMMEEKSLETFEVLKTKLLYSTNLEQICKRQDPNADTNKSKSEKKGWSFLICHQSGERQSCLPFRQ